MLVKQQSSPLSVSAEHLIQSLVMKKVFFFFLEKRFHFNRHFNNRALIRQKCEIELKTDKQIEVKSLKIIVLIFLEFAYK